MKHSRFIKSVLFHSGCMALCRNFFSNNSVAILRYHAIVASDDNYYASQSICLSPDLFEAQIKYLSRAYTIISLDQVADCLANKLPFPKKSVVLTFDDGYRDNYRAYRIMKKYGATGTFYIAAGCIDAGEPLWLFEVIYLLRKTKAASITITVGDFDKTFPLTNADDRLAAVGTITTLIKSNNLTFREKTRDQIRSQTGDVEDYQDKAARVMLTWKQVQEMSDNGMDIGGHTVTHLNLPNADQADARSEIINCKKLIENKIGRQVGHFSYPNGGNYDYYNNVVKDYVKQADYLTSTTSNNGLAEITSDPYELNRIRITDHLAEVVYQIECEALINRTLGR